MELFYPVTGTALRSPLKSPKPADIQPLPPPKLACTHELSPKRPITSTVVLKGTVVMMSAQCSAQSAAADYC